MKIIKRLSLILTLSILLIFNIYTVHGCDFNSNYLSIKNDKEATLKNKYPVIILTNKTNKDIDITYSFFYTEKEDKVMCKKFKIPSNQSVSIKIPELYTLVKSSKTRTIRFSWNEDGKTNTVTNEI